MDASLGSTRAVFCRNREGQSPVPRLPGRTAADADDGAAALSSVTLSPRIGRIKREICRLGESRGDTGDEEDGILGRDAIDKMVAAAVAAEAAEAAVESGVDHLPPTSVSVKMCTHGDNDEVVGAVGRRRSSRRRKHPRPPSPSQFLPPSPPASVAVASAVGAVGMAAFPTGAVGISPPPTAPTPLPAAVGISPPASTAIPFPPAVGISDPTAVITGYTAFSRWEPQQQPWAGRGVLSGPGPTAELAATLRRSPRPPLRHMPTHMLYRAHVPSVEEEEEEEKEAETEKEGGEGGGVDPGPAVDHAGGGGGGGVDGEKKRHWRACEQKYCRRRPSFGSLGDPRATWCASHKKDGQVDITSRRCEREGCDRIPSFRDRGDRRARFCAAHKAPGMEDYHRGKRFCRLGAAVACNRTPSFGFVGGKRISCAVHKSKGMLNLNIGRCGAGGGCKLTPSYGVRGSPPVFCAGHAPRGMVNVVSKRCEEPSCDRIPSYGWDVDGSRAAFCSTHMAEGMVNVRHTRCAQPECRRQPGYGRIPGKAAVYCKEHREVGMVDVKNNYAERAKKTKKARKKR